MKFRMAICELLCFALLCGTLSGCSVADSLAQTMIDAMATPTAEPIVESATQPTVEPTSEPISEVDESTLEYTMTKEYIEGKTSSGFLVTTYQNDYPLFLGNLPAAQKLNDYYFARNQESKTNYQGKDFDALYSELKEWNDTFPLAEQYESTVTYNKNGYISVLEIYKPSRRGLRWTKGHILDISTGNELTYSDFIDGSETEIQDLLEMFESGALRSGLEDSQNLPCVLCEEGLRFYVNGGDSVDLTEVTIPFTDSLNCRICASEILGKIAATPEPQRTGMEANEIQQDSSAEGLTGQYWCQNIQAPHAFVFYQDGTGVRCAVDPEKFGVNGNWNNITSNDLDLAVYGETFQWNLEEGTLTLSYSSGGIQVLHAVTTDSPIEWDGGLSKQISEIPVDAIFYYETDWVQTEAPINACYIAPTGVKIESTP